MGGWWLWPTTGEHRGCCRRWCHSFRTNSSRPKPAGHIGSAVIRVLLPSQPMGRPRSDGSADQPAGNPRPDQTSTCAKRHCGGCCTRPPARAGNIPALDFEGLDLPRKRGVMIGRGGHKEYVFWASGAARLLSRYLVGRRRGPVCLTQRHPYPGRRMPTHRPGKAVLRKRLHHLQTNRRLVAFLDWGGSTAVRTLRWSPRCRTGLVS